MEQNPEKQHKHQEHKQYLAAKGSFHYVTACSCGNVYIQTAKGNQKLSSQEFLDLSDTILRARIRMDPNWLGQWLVSNN